MDGATDSTTGGNRRTTFYILDLDRTILDTIKSTELMEGVVALHDTDLSTALTQKFEEASSLGESFSMRDFIVEQVGEDEMLKIEEKFITLASERDVLMPGAKELMTYVGALPDAAFGIMTYGSERGQRMKIRAGGLGDIPALVTGETFKGAQIASWRQDDDLYHLPEELGGYVVTSIVLIDDKPFSFKGLPIDCRGYWVKSIYDAGVEKIPSQVQAESDLFAIIAAEKARS